MDNMELIKSLLKGIDTKVEKTNDHLVTLNGKVAEHEKFKNIYENPIKDLIEDKKNTVKFWRERIVWVVLILALGVLQVTGIINL